MNIVLTLVQYSIDHFTLNVMNIIIYLTTVSYVSASWGPSKEPFDYAARPFGASEKQFNRTIALADWLPICII